VNISFKHNPLLKLKSKLDLFSSSSCVGSSNTQHSLRILWKLTDSQLAKTIRNTHTAVDIDRCFRYSLSGIFYEYECANTSGISSQLKYVQCESLLFAVKSYSAIQTVLLQLYTNRLK